jgi:hypothetical protein
MPASILGQKNAAEVYDNFGPGLDIQLSFHHGTPATAISSVLLDVTNSLECEHRMLSRIWVHPMSIQSFLYLFQDYNRIRLLLRFE